MKIKEFKYIALNKPKGYVCALKDNLHPVVTELIKEKIKGLHIVGRLDKDTTGVLILTNDGAYTHSATHPKKHVAKTYVVTPKSPLSKEDIESIKNGMQIDHGKTQLKPGEVTEVNGKYELTITEGKFHQIKKMFFALNNEVIELHRKTFDGITLSIDEGQYIVADTIEELKNNHLNQDK